MSNDKGSRLPAWLVGLILAVVLFAIGILVFQALGFGDNPVVDPDAVGLTLALDPR